MVEPLKYPFRLLCLGAILLLVPSPAAPDALLSSTPVERPLADGETHVHTAELSPGPWRVVLEHFGIEARLEARDEDRKSLAAVDLRCGRFGRDALLLEPTAATSVELLVRPSKEGATPGRYRLILERLEDNPRRLDAERAMSDAARATAREEPDADREATALLAEAAAAWEALGDRRREAEAVHARALAHRRLDEPSRAAELFSRARELWRTLDEPVSIAATLNQEGLCHRSLGRLDEAQALFEAAAEIYRRLGETRLEAATRNNLGLIHLDRGDLDRGAAIYQEILVLLRRASDPRLEIVLHNNLGGIYSHRGEHEIARRHLSTVLEMRRALGDRSGEALALNNLASVDRYNGHWHDALARWSRALEIFRELGKTRYEARVLNNLGTLHRDLGDFERARAFFLEALTLRRAAEDWKGEAITVNHLATVHRQLGEWPAARAARQRALELRRQLGDRRGEARVLVWLGRDALDEADPHAGLRHFDEARAIFARDTVDDPRNAVQALAGRGRALAALGRAEEAARTLAEALEKHGQIDDRGGEIPTRVALAALERQRGRLGATLEHADAAIARIETLRGEIPDTDLRGTFLATKRRAYELRVDALLEMAERHADPRQVRAALETAERARARSLLDLLAESRIGARQGEGERPAEPEILGAGGIQALLDPGTTLLQYALGEERSFLWRVTRNEIEVYELPPGSRIEGWARRAHGELATLVVGAASTGPEALRELANGILGPVLPRLTDGETSPERLVIIADGALVYVPFAALPLADGEPLLTRFEVIHLPSASALAALRRTTAKRAAGPPPRRAAVVFADPHAGPEWDRLPASRAEAETLLALLPAGEAEAALGAAASRDAVLEGALGGARVVHLATHGVIDAVRPELSGLVLARSGTAAEPREGFLRLRDIYALELEAELVVLSGCRTALGKEVRGEGLVGLVRGFFQAGAPRVIASLWRVEDQATALLMKRFYEALFVAGEPPPAALRNAQLAVRAERRFRHPSYWAGFILQGDWHFARTLRGEKVGEMRRR